MNTGQDHDEEVYDPYFENKSIRIAQVITNNGLKILIAP